MKRFLTLLLVLAPVAAHAQGSLSRVFPNGAQRGTTVALTFGGEKIPDRATLVVDGEGITPLGPFEKGVGKVQIAPDAAPGVRQLRLVGTKEATTPRPFAVGSIAEAEEKEPNNTPEQAQRVTEFPVTFNGTLVTRPDLDVFRVALKRGECLVAAGESRVLGSPTNLLVRIRDAAGRELLVQMDYRTRDPLVGFTAPADGEYLVEIQEVMNNYSNIDANYVYRLTLTKGPWLDTVFPAGARRGETAHLVVNGWNLGRPGPATLSVDVPVPADAPALYSVFAGGAPNRVTLAVGDAPEVSEAEPGTMAAAAPTQMVTLPATINGTFGFRGDTDTFRFLAKAGEKLVLNVDARELGSPADAILQVRDAAGKLLATADDSNGTRDPQLVWSAPTAGEYSVVLRDVASLSRGGPLFFYRLTLAPPAPSLRMTTPSATVALKPGGTVELPVTVIRSFTRSPISITVEGLPAGVTATTGTVPASPGGAASSEVKLTLTAAAGTAPTFGMIRITGLSEGGQPPTAQAEATWVLSTDRSGTLAEGRTARITLVVPD